MRRLVILPFLVAFGLAALAAPEKEAPPIDASPEHIAELIAKLEGGGMANQVRANSAYKELMKIGRPAIPQLVEAAEGDKPWVRLWAAAALAATGDKRAVDPVLAVMDDPLTSARMIAVWHGAGLHHLDSRIAPAVVRRLNDESADVRKWAVRALSERIKFQGSVEAVEQLTHDGSPGGRAVAYKLLMQHRKQDAAATIGKTLSEEKDWRVRSAAVRCLGEGVMKPHQPMFDLLFQAMADESEEVKADAVEVTMHVLKETADRMPRDVRAPIIDKLEKVLPPMLDAELPRLRGASLYLLAAGLRGELFERALKAADDPEPVVRAYALQTLARCGVRSQKVAEKALARLEDDSHQVRSYAIRLLGWATGARFEFDPAAPAEKRAEAVAKIKAEVEKAME